MSAHKPSCIVYICTCSVENEEVLDYSQKELKSIRRASYVPEVELEEEELE